MAQAEDVHSPIRDSAAEARPSGSAKRAIDPSRRAFIGGSDARIIMGCTVTCTMRASAPAPPVAMISN